MQLRAEDLARLREQRWEERLGEPITVKFRGETYLRQREDGACIFWMSDGRCRIHAEFSFEEKPIACQLFPFVLLPAREGVRAGLSFACSSVLAAKGAELRTHTAELQRMADALSEIDDNPIPPMLTDTLRAEHDELRALERTIDGWMTQRDLSLSVRLDGLAWLVSMLAQAKLESVRGQRFIELLDTLRAALPEELEFDELPPPTTRQMRLLRQAVFARTEDPKIGAVRRRGRMRTALGQFFRSRRFASGRGFAPVIGANWPANVELSLIERISGAADEREAKAIDELITRYVRVTILGGRAWGFGYYLWPAVMGLQALILNLACIGWLARLHAAGHHREAITHEDVAAALSRIDRSAGRAKWLGASAERLRIRYLAMDNGLRRLPARQRFVLVE